MTELILHHFKNSPFSEKIRLVLGCKQLPWKSVIVPMILPKPDVIALTGGYRRTPVLQIGADIYCDTALICRVLDRVAPQPPLYAPATAGIAQIIAQWADGTLFWSAVPYTMQPAAVAHIVGDASPEFLKALAADRAAMTAGMRRATPVDAGAQLTSYLGWLDGLLGDGRGFLLGDAPCIADFAAVHPLWFLRLAPPLAAIFAPFPRASAWRERVIAFGHGSPETLSSGEAIAVAARSAPAATAVEPGLGFSPGAQVTVSAMDYATDLVPGTLVGLSTTEVVIARHDERAGDVHVHFPRAGYQIKSAG